MVQFGLSNNVIKAINSVFVGYEEIIQVVIYGSRATENFKIGSDIDLTVTETNLTLTQLLEIENKLDDLLLPYKIDLSLKRTISNTDLLEHINRVGKVFYSKNQK